MRRPRVARPAVLAALAALAVAGCGSGSQQLSVQPAASGPSNAVDGSPSGGDGSTVAAGGGSGTGSSNGAGGSGAAGSSGAGSAGGGTPVRTADPGRGTSGGTSGGGSSTGGTGTGTGGTATAGTASSRPGHLSSPGPTPSPRPTPTAIGGTVTVTDADSGMTVHLAVGQHLRVRLSSTSWDPPVSSAGAVVARRSSSGGYPTDQPVDATFDATARGSADVTSQSDAACFHTEPRCLMASRQWQVHVVVD